VPKHSDKPLEYDEIVDGIFVGTNACCETHVNEVLLSRGIEADISLEEHHVDVPVGVKFYLWLPVKDHTPPSLEQIRVGVQTIRTLVKLKKKMYIHCHNGHGRAPALVAAYFIARGKKPAEAIDIVESRRRGAHINAAQRKALEQFARARRKSS
jgi:hypothetical protein